MSHSIRTGAAILASAVMAFSLSYQTAGASQARADVYRSAPEASDLAAREARLRRWVHTGRLEGWLSVAEARERYREIGRLERREAEMRAAAGGVLSQADWSELDQALRDMAKDLRWTREHNRHGRPYQPH